MMYLARFISTLFSPYFLILPTPFFLIYKTTGDYAYALKWTIFSGIFLGILFLISLYAVKKGYFTDLDVSNRKQRPLLFGILSIIAIIYLLSILILHGPVILFLGVLGMLVAVGILSIINTKVKASMHVTGITAVIFGFGIFYGGLNFLWLLLIPLIAWSRIKVHRHTLSEVVAGCMTGTVLTLGFYFLVKYIGVVAF